MTVRYIGSHGDEFTGKSLSFEVVEDINETIRRVDLEVKNVSKSGKGKTSNIYYEFKSVKVIPPTHFLEQFSKDLANPNVTDLSQLKWVFDGKKIDVSSVEFKHIVLEKIKMIDLDKLSNKFEMGAGKEVYDAIEKYFHQIFTIIK